uniref:Uncharacterized protein n=1 Tax=Brassica oleracea TaxID=3712 RepID=A0A3P6CH30_BRAOL|nr:unnamed protein product [Brassica oleracea]
MNFDANMVIILSALLCALILALGLTRYPCQVMRLRAILSGIDGGGRQARIEEARTEEVSCGCVRVERGDTSY